VRERSERGRGLFVRATYVRSYARFVVAKEGGKASEGAARNYLSDVYSCSETRGRA
jgi:hypothetical protein